MESIAAPTTDWNFLIDNISFTPVPLSGVLLLLGAGLARLAAYGRRKRGL
jgi:hypothetical protein